MVAARREAAQASARPTPAAVQEEMASKADPSVAAYAQWLADSFAESRSREETLSREIAAVREAAAVGATALVELRAAVQKQLESVAHQLGRLEQDLDSTKLELAEVVIDKEADEGELKQEVDALRRMMDTDLQSFRVTLKEVQEGQSLAVEQKVSERIGAVSESVASLRMLLDSKVSAAEEKAVQKAEEIRHAVTQAVEARLEEGREFNMGLFKKMDKVMTDQIENIQQTQAVLEKNQQKGLQQAHEEFRHSLMECDELSRKVMGMHEQLEPRVSMVEESQRSADSALEHLRSEVKQLLGGRHASPYTPMQASPMQVPSGVASSDASSRHASTGSKGPELGGAGGSARPAASADAIPHAPSQPQQPPPQQKPQQQTVNAGNMTVQPAPKAVATASQQQAVASAAGNKQTSSSDAWRFSHNAPTQVGAPVVGSGKPPVGTAASNPMWAVGQPQPRGVYHHAAGH